jgi:ABC-type sugar transport system permease subunit
MNFLKWYFKKHRPLHHIGELLFFAAVIGLPFWIIIALVTLEKAYFGTEIIAMFFVVIVYIFMACGVISIFVIDPAQKIRKDYLRHKDLEKEAELQRQEDIDEYNSQRLADCAGAWTDHKKETTS